MNNGSIKKIGIFSQVLFQETNEIISKILSIKGSDAISFYLNPELHEFLEKLNSVNIKKLKKTSLEEMDVECIISIGGDGTILRVARTRPEIPILSINKGRKGFMTEMEPDEVVPRFKDFLEGKFNIEEHYCIEALVDGKSLGLAINEFVITSVDVLKPIDFKLLIDDEITSGSLADGIIIATAVGSTGHCLSSGGCVIDPALHNFQISWINPINLAIRPVVLATFRKIKIRCATRINPIKIVIDGQIMLEFDTPIEFMFEYSKNKVKFFRNKHFTSRWRQYLHPEIRESM